MNSPLIPESPEEQNLLLGEHALGLLDPEREAEVRAWIERDDNAARMALRWQQHWLSVSDRLPPEPPSDSLWKRIDANLVRLKQSSATRDDAARHDADQASASTKAPWLLRWLGGGLGLGLGAGLALALVMQMGPSLPARRWKARHRRWLPRHLTATPNVWSLSCRHWKIRARRLGWPMSRPAVACS